MARGMYGKFWKKSTTLKVWKWNVELNITSNTVQNDIPFLNQWVFGKAIEVQSWGDINTVT